MRNLRFTGAALLTVLVAACGGGGSEPAPTPPAAAPAPAPAPAPLTAQTITFGSILAGTQDADERAFEEGVGVKPNSTARSLIGNASSGLKVVFSSLTPTVCVVDDAVPNVRAVAGGAMCRVAADQPGNATFAAATRVVRSVFVGTPTTLQPDDWKVVSTTTGNPRFSPFDVGLKPQVSGSGGDAVDVKDNYTTQINSTQFKLAGNGGISPNNLLILPISLTEGTTLRCTVTLVGILVNLDVSANPAQAIIGEYEGSAPGDACTTKETGTFTMVKTGTTPPKIGKLDILYPANCPAGRRVNFFVDDRFILSDTPTPGASSDGGTTLLAGARRVRAESEDGTQMLFNKTIVIPEDGSIVDLLTCPT
jgi:hypothetical protein